MKVRFCASTSTFAVLGSVLLACQGVEPGSDTETIFEVGRVSLAQIATDAPSVPLSTRGRYVVDANNNRFKLKSVNWFGASDRHEIVYGLAEQPISHIVALIKEWGFNSVRLPFSNLMIHNKNPVAAELLTANPDFIGLTPLEIYDRTVQALTDAGIVVILNNHTTFSEWCCGFDYNGLWYHTGSSFAYNQTVEMWQADWLTMINRYKHNKLVAGADLRNEVRTMRWNDTHFPESPNWGMGDKNDWHLASREMGRLALEANPDILIIVEGVNWWGSLPAFGGGRPHLKPVRDTSVQLQYPNKLVYAAHNYHFIGPNHNGDDGTSGGQTRYGQMDEQTFRNTIQDEWGFVTEANKHYTAPIWLSEFGMYSHEPREEDREWLRRLVDFLNDNDIGFAYWPLNGNDDWGLLTKDWSSTRKDDFRFEHLDRLISYQGRTGAVAAAPQFSQIAIHRGDDMPSVHLKGNDWHHGASKGNCRDGERLVGLSQNYHALCSDTFYGPLWASDRDYNVQGPYETSSRYHGTGDWASGFTKYECPQNYYGAGFTKHYWGTSGIFCAKSDRPLSNMCRTAWFDRGDNRASNKGGDFAHGSYKGQCADHEYVAGIAQRNGSASALLCCAAQIPGALPLEYKARPLHHRFGFAEGDAWVATTADHSSGHLIYGPYERNRWGSGNKRAVFRMLVDVTNANNDKVVTVDIYDGHHVLAIKDIFRHDFSGPGRYSDITLDFDIAADSADRAMEARIFWHDTSYVKVEKITILNR